MQGFGSGSFSGVAGFADSGATANSGIGVFGKGGGPQQPSPGQPPQAGGPGVRGFGGSNEFGKDANGVEGFGSGSFAGVAGFGEAAPATRPVTAAGVYGQGGFGSNNGVEGRGTGNVAGVAGFGDTSPTANSGIGVFAVGGAPAPGTVNAGGLGVHAIGAGGAGFTPLNLAVGVYGLGGADNAPGVLGQAGSAVADGVHGFSVSGNGVLGESGNGVGVRATSTSSTALVAVGTTGLFASSSALGGTAGQLDGNVVINGNLTVTGAKNAAVSFPDGSQRRLYCVESPDSWFEDFGFGELSNGEARVPLDPGFSAIVEGEGYHVFITEYEGNNALYVTQRTSAGFVVRATAQTATGTFSYRVVAKRKDIAAPRFEEVQVSGEGPRAHARPADLCSRQASAA